MTTRFAFMASIARLHHQEMGLHHDVGLRDEDDLDHAAVDLAVQVPAEAFRGGAQTFVRLFE